MVSLHQVRVARPRPYDLVWSLLSLLVFAGAWLQGHGWRVVETAVGCPFHRLTGRPCAGCGATRALCAFVRGDLLDALLYNPLATALAFVSVGVILYTLAVRLGRLPRLRVVLDGRAALAARLAVPLALLANWAFLLGLGRV